jgi:hypothetical protein
MIYKCVQTIPAISERMTCECVLMIQLYQSVSFATIISVTSVDFPVQKSSTSLDPRNIAVHCRPWVTPLHVLSFWIPQSAFHRTVVPKRTADCFQGIYVNLFCRQIVILQNYSICGIISQDEVRSCFSRAMSYCRILSIYCSITYLQHIRHSKILKKEKPPTLLKL